MTIETFEKAKSILMRIEKTKCFLETCTKCQVTNLNLPDAFLPDNLKDNPELIAVLNNIELTRHENKLKDIQNLVESLEAEFDNL